MSRQRVLTARERLLRASIAVLGAERMLHVDAPAMGRLKAAEDEMSLAARDLTNAVDDSPPRDWPKDWATSGDGSA